MIEMCVICQVVYYQCTSEIMVRLYKLYIWKLLNCYDCTFVAYFNTKEDSIYIYIYIYIYITMTLFNFEQLVSRDLSRFGHVVKQQKSHK